MAATSTVMEHFAQVLRRGQLEAVTFGGGDPFIATAREQIAGGTLAEDPTAELFDHHDRQARQRAAKTGSKTGSKSGSKAASKKGSEAGATETEDASISVVLSLASIPEDGGSTHQGLLLLPAVLHRDGRLEPDLEGLTAPWIPIERLTVPGVSDREVMVGTQRTFWRFATAELAARISRTETLAQAIDLAEDMFRRVAGKGLAEFAADAAADGTVGATVEHELCYIQEHTRMFPARTLVDLYEGLQRESSPGPLIERVVAGHQGPRTPEDRIHADGGLLAAARLARGSMSDEHPLTPSQRRAVHAYLVDGPGTIAAVSGPPGTGKTTMLQAVVASEITRCALEREDAPVIVGTSTNNQAVTNIISSFASVAKANPGTLDLRWIPQADADADGASGSSSDGGSDAADDGAAAASDVPLRSLAVYCPSKAKLDQARKDGHLVEQSDRSGAYATYSDEDYLATARDRFLRRMHAHLGSIDEPARVQDRLHEALAEVDDLRLALLQAMHENGPSDAYLRLCAQAEASPHLRGNPKVAELRTREDLAALDRTLDVTLRYAEFWLAVHYYEAQWIWTGVRKGEAFLDADKERWKSTAEINDRYWAQAAALTPCFVMTVYQLPKYFQTYKAPDGSRPDRGHIDLLIVDEAGQVDTPLALPLLGLAQRALIVGDEQQLAPIWSLDDETDREIALAEGLAPAEWTDGPQTRDHQGRSLPARGLQERGLTASTPSSLMRAASHASRWSYGEDQPGLLLREHFRCHPEIIGYCNDLLYGGQLEPMRPAKSSLLHGRIPAFAWIDVPESQDRRQGSSRVNPVEAAVIADWIVAHFAELFATYHDRVENPEKRVEPKDLIGVVTPFAAQASLITAEIRRAAGEARAADPGSAVPADLASLVAVGTAHRLQGAERPVVLFSAVYGTDSGQSSFIDATPPLMNVAVSRAKDLFLVVAAPNRWANGPVFEVMARHAQRIDPHVLLAGADEPAMQVDGPTSAPAEPTAEWTVVSAEPTSEPEEPTAEPTTEPATATAEPAGASADADPAVQGALSAVLRRWERIGAIRAEDAPLGAAALNRRLAEAGVLEGEPGQWTPSRLAAVLGVLEVEKTGSNGDYTSIEYTPAAQELLLGLYREGRL
ncbi:DEAD/DEAH box helicase [Brachybacterium sp. DNPG3]